MAPPGAAQDSGAVSASKAPNGARAESLQGVPASRLDFGSQPQAGSVGDRSGPVKESGRAGEVNVSQPVPVFTVRARDESGATMRTEDFEL